MYESLACTPKRERFRKSVRDSGEKHRADWKQHRLLQTEQAQYRAEHRVNLALPPPIERRTSTGQVMLLVCATTCLSSVWRVADESRETRQQVMLLECETKSLLGMYDRRERDNAVMLLRMIWSHIGPLCSNWRFDVCLLLVLVCPGAEHGANCSTLSASRRLWMLLCSNLVKLSRRLCEFEFAPPTSSLPDFFQGFCLVLYENEPLLASIELNYAALYCILQYVVTVCVVLS